MKQLLFFILHYISISTLAAVTVTATATDTATATATPDQCREWGFDPSNLSCDTCALLLEQHATALGLSTPQFQTECQLCCQTYRKNPILHSQNQPSSSETTTTTGHHNTRYQTATIVYGSYGLQGRDEVKDFLEQDIQKLMDIKGDDVLSVMETDPMQVPVLLFFKEANVNFREQPPDEIIILEKWKRDDMKELIINLLPNLG